MEFDFKGYCFSFETLNKELEKFIGNYQDLKSTVKQLFKINNDIDIQLSYIDCDGCFDISSQNTYNQVLSYHTHKYEEFINILVKKQIKLNGVPENNHINYDDEVMFSRDRSFIENTNKDIAILRAELNDLKKSIEHNQKETIDTFQVILENAFKKLEERIVKSSKSERISSCNITPHNSTSLIANSMLMIKEANFEILSNGQDYQDYQEMNELDNDDINYVAKKTETPQFFCCICNSLDISPKYTCMICNSFYVCPYCEVEHSNHPLITLVNPLQFYNKEKLCFYVFNDKTKTFKKYFNSIRNYFTNKGVLQMQLVCKQNFTFMKPLQKTYLDIIIYNLSSAVILDDELMLTAINNGSFKVESKLICKSIDKYDGFISERIAIQAPSRSGIYNFDIILMHESSKLEYDPIKLKITVTAGVEDFFTCDQDIEVYFRGYPNIKNKLNLNQKIEIKNMIEEKVTNLSLFKIDNILQSFNYDYDKALTKILNLK
jgi:hypothetical protein